MYIMSENLRAFCVLAQARMARGQMSTLLLEGPPGGGKTAFARELARRIGGEFFYYSGSPDKERDLLYEIDVQGVVERKAAWVHGPAWAAFNTSKEKPAVLLIDEVDKTSRGFDAFLLRLLEEGAFRSPGGETITANQGKLVVILTSNGRRELRPEVLRRCQRLSLPLPTGERLVKIITQLAGQELPSGLVELVIRLGRAVRQFDAEQNPSPKELAQLCLDLLTLRDSGLLSQKELVQEVAASWLFKGMTSSDLTNLVKFDWVKALITEAKR